MLSTVEIIFASVFVTTAFISLASLLIILYIINEMKIWNGYTSMIYVLSISQLIAQLPLFFIFLHKSLIAEVIILFLITLGKYSVSIWTNIMTCMVASLVFYLKPYNIVDNFKTILTITTIVSLMFAILVSVTAIIGRDGTLLKNIVYLVTCIRLASLGFNVVVYLAMFFHVYYNESYRNIGLIGEESLRLLVKNIGYYPITLSIIRVGTSWHELSYGFVGNLNPINPLETASLFIYAISVNSVGINLFIIFLITQPNAYEYFLDLFYLKNNCLKHNFCNKNNCLNKIMNPKAKIFPMLNNNHIDFPRPVLLFSRDANLDFVDDFEKQIQIQKNSFLFNSNSNDPTNYNNQFKKGDILKPQSILQLETQSIVQLQPQSILQLQSVSSQPLSSQPRSSIWSNLSTIIKMKKSQEYRGTHGNEFINKLNE